MNKKPNFFIVGAGKCGTTAMHEYLGKHPDIFMARKELHHFAKDLLPSDMPMLDRTKYLSQFNGARNEKVIGESSVFYLYSKVAARKIKNFNNDAKILIHVRNPIDVIASHHSQVIYEGAEPIKNLKDALDIEPLRKNGLHMPENFVWKDTLLYRELVRFSPQIQRFIDAFGKQKIHFIVFDDFVEDTIGEYKRTCEFLDVNSTFRPEFDVVNANKAIRSEFIMDVIVRDPPQWATRISHFMFSLATRNAIKSAVKKLNTSYVPRQRMEPKLRRQLKAEFLPEVERLSKLLDRDLTAWCR